MGKKTVSVIPAYSCEKTIGKVVEGALKHSSKVIVVDDGSKDETAKRARSAGAVVLSHGRNFGKASAIRTGVNFARTALDPDCLVMLDGDLQHDPEEIPSLLRPLSSGKCDVSIGSRLLTGRNGGMPLYRYLANSLSSKITSFLIGQRITDLGSGFRAFNRQALSKLSFKGKGYEIELSMTLEAAAKGLRLSEVPIRAIYGKEKSHIRPLSLSFGILKFWGAWIFFRGSFK